MNEYTFLNWYKNEGDYMKPIKITAKNEEEAIRIFEGQHPNRGYDPPL